MTSSLSDPELNDSSSINRISYADFFAESTQPNTGNDGSEKQSNHGGYKASKFCLQVFGISPNVSEENLTGLFSQCGNLISLKIHSEVNGAPSFALIEYADCIEPACI